MESLKDFAISITFILITSVCLLFFILQYPVLNNQESVLTGTPQFNETAQNLSNLLGNYQSQQNLDINISTADQPTVNALSLQLVSTTSTSRNLMSRLTASFKYLTNLVGNALGISGGTVSLLIGALISLFSLVLFYYVVKLIRYGT